jgi:hypothetical protein
MIFAFPVMTTSFDLIPDGPTFSNVETTHLSQRGVVYEVGSVEEAHT